MHGFYNNGNTCYFNAALQCMLRVHELSERVLREPYAGDCLFTARYSELVRIYFQTAAHSKIDVAPLLKTFQDRFPRFKARHPHDTQDALFCIIDILEVTYPYLKELVYGEKEQRTVCPSGSTSEKVPFSMLIVHGEHGTSVNALVGASETWDTLTDYVDGAGVTHHVATTRSSISRYPRILFVSFDAKVRVTADALFEGKYEVCGSIIHVGSQSGGHYMSMVRLGTTWYAQDDDTLTVVDFPAFHDHHVLMYSLKNPPS